MGENEGPVNAAQKPRRPFHKKRKTFLATAKKYAKKGQMGRGTKIPEETYQYFLGILASMKQGIADKDERVALVNNVLERTKGEELNVIGNQLGCRLVEILLPYASEEDLERFIEILSPELRRLSADNFSSHVIETVLRVSCERSIEHLQDEEDSVNTEDTSDTEEVPKKKRKKDKKEMSKYSENHIKTCHDFTIKMCKYALNNLEEFVWDDYANHILRSALKCLSGIKMIPGEKPKVNHFQETVGVKKGIPPHITKIDYKIVPDEFKEIVIEFGKRLSSWPQFKDLPFKSITSALLQVLLYAVKNADKHLTRDLLKKLLEESFAPDDWASNVNDDKKEDKMEENPRKELLPPVFKCEPSVRLVEAALFVAKKKMFTQIYAKCFINRLGQLATRKMLNFTVQRLIDNCQIKEEFEPMFDEIAPSFPQLLPTASANTGVLVALAQAARRLRARQAQFVTHLESALNCSEAGGQKYFAVCCLRLQPLEQLDTEKLEEEYFIYIHGSVILQAVLDFQRPAKAVQSLLELSPGALVQIFCDAKGSHIADALCAGQCVGVKARDKLVWKLKGYYQTLVLSVYGSRAFDHIFKVASFDQKLKIMAEISEKSSRLNSTASGNILAAKYDVETFKSSQKAWEQAWKRKENTEVEGNK